MISDVRTTSLIHFCAPPRVGDDLSRVMRFLTTLEDLVPGMQLDYVLGEQDFESLSLPREVWLARQLNAPSSGVAMLHGGHTGAVSVMFSDQVGFGGKPPRECLAVLLTVGDDLGAGKEREWLLRTGDALCAWRGTWNPPMIGRRLVGQRVTSGFGGRAPPFSPTPYGLPPLFGLRMPEGIWVPHDLAWLNYWSPDVATFLGVPDPLRDGEWVALTDRSQETGAWILALTKDPIDLDRSDHVLALQQAWARFDKVGVREPDQQLRAKWASEGHPYQS